MSLTRKLLKELELPASAIEQIIAAHAETVDALKAERDAALAERDAAQSTASANETAAAQRDELRETAARLQEEHAALRSEYNDFRARTQAERHASQRRAALQDALRQAGANEHALPLLAQTIATTEEDWDGDVLRDAPSTLAPVIAAHSGLFAQSRPLPTDPVAPPLSSGVLTPADIRCMSSEEINRNWSVVSAALKQLP